MRSSFPPTTSVSAEQAVPYAKEIYLHGALLVATSLTVTVLRAVLWRPVGPAIEFGAYAAFSALALIVAAGVGYELFPHFWRRRTEEQLMRAPRVRPQDVRPGRLGAASRTGLVVAICAVIGSLALLQDTADAFPATAVAAAFMIVGVAWLRMGRWIGDEGARRGLVYYLSSTSDQRSTLLMRIVSVQSAPAEPGR